MEFPDWLLFEVLLRLPVDSVFSCRIVSKQWLWIASDPYFIRAYANNSRASASSPPWIVLSPFVLGEISCDLNNDPSSNLIIPGDIRPPSLCSIRQKPQARDQGMSRITVMGVSDGLVLYCRKRKPEYDDDYIYDFSVCNPITGHRVKTAAPLRLPKDLHRLGCGFLTRVDQGDFTLRSYRIVHAMQKPELDAEVVFFNVYYSEVGDWKEFKVALRNNNGNNQKLLLALQTSAAVLNGILNWADMRLGVIAYDPETDPERMRLIRYPNELEVRFLRLCLCVAYRGEELRYYGGYSSGVGCPIFEIWKLEDYNVDSGGERWRPLHKIEARSMYVGIDIPPNVMLEVVCLDPFDSDVVYLINGHGKPFSYDMKSGIVSGDDQCKLIKGDGSFNRCWFSLPCTHLLVVPPWPTQVAEKHLLIL